MNTCRICHNPLRTGEKARGTCDLCEQSIATAIKKKIIRISQSDNQHRKSF